MAIRGKYLGCLVLFSLPFLAASCALTWMESAKLGRLRRIESHVRWDGVAKLPDGPVRVSGLIELPEGRTLWAYRGAWREGKSSKTLCTRDNLQLETAHVRLADPIRGSAISLPLTSLLAARIDWIGIGTVGPPRGANLRLVSGRTMPVSIKSQSRKTNELPEVPSGTCAPADGKVYYEMATLPPRTRVTILACKLGNELLPCDDGVDAISTESPSAIATGYTSGSPSGFFVSAWISILSLTIGVLVVLMFPSRPKSVPMVNA